MSHTSSDGEYFADRGPGDREPDDHGPGHRGPGVEPSPVGADDVDLVQEDYSDVLPDAPEPDYR